MNKNNPGCWDPDNKNCSCPACGGYNDKILWDGENLSEVMSFLGLKLDLTVPAAKCGKSKYLSKIAKRGLRIIVRGSVLSAKVGDYIIKGKDNKFYSAGYAWAALY